MGCVFIAAGVLMVRAPHAYSSDPGLIELNSDGIAMPRAKAKEVAEWMSEGNDLIFLGRVESSARDSTRLEGGGVSFERGRMCVRVDDILRGYSSDPAVCFTHSRQLATRRIQPGQNVLVWITRRPDLPRRLEGNFYVLDTDGALLSDGSTSSAMDRTRRDPRKLRYQDLPLDTVRQRDIRAILRGAVAIAAVGFAEKRWNLNKAPWKCLDARWVFGTTTHLPTCVRFADTSTCGGYPEADTYLIPVPPGYQGDTLFINACPPFLRVMGGEVTALGVPLTDLDRVLTRSANGGIEVIAPSWWRGSSR